MFSPFTVFSVLSSLCWELKNRLEMGGNEMVMKAKLARGWALFGMGTHSPGCASLLQLHLTADCNHQVNHRIWGGTGVCTRKLLRELSVLLRGQAALHPSESVSLKINSLRSVLITAVLRTSDSVFLSEKAPRSLAQYGYYLPT